MFTLEKIIPFIKKARYAGIIDISKAYLHIPVSKDHKHLFAFQFDSVKYSFRAMPFGLNTAPFYFTRLMKPVLAFLREKFMITIFSYIDDIIVLEDCFDKAKINLDITLNFLRFLGFKLNPKSDLAPVTKFKFLGVDFNLEKDEMQNCSKNINNAVLLIEKILDK